MLNIAICDDDKIQLNIFSTYVNEYIKLHNHFAMPSLYDKAFDFADDIESGSIFDVVLLDICMPGITGIEIGKQLKKIRSECQIIFVTTSRDYAVEAISLEATHYLVKPFDKQSLFDALDRAFSHLAPKISRSIPLTGTDNIVYSVNINDIIYIESFNHTKKIKCVNNEFYIRDNQENIFKRITDMCDDNRFLIIFRGIILNQRFISSIETNSIILKSGEKLPVAKRKVSDIKRAYLDYMVGDEI